MSCSSIPEGGFYDVKTRVSFGARARCADAVFGNVPSGGGIWTEGSFGRHGRRRRAPLCRENCDRWGVGVGYNYPLSKRTNVYAVAGYYQDKITDEYDSKAKEYNNRDPSTTTVMLGMRHRF